MKEDSKSWQWWLAALSASVATLSLLLGLAPAQASTQNSNGDVCPFSHTLCMFEETAFGGERFTVAPLTPGQGVCVDLVEHGWGGRANSVINTSTSSNAMFQSDDCTGQPMEIPTGFSSDLLFSPSSVFVS